MSKSKNETPSEVRVSADVLDDLQIRFFQISIAGKISDAFLFRKNGNYYAYINECRHLPVPLDLYAPSVFNGAMTAFQCHQHGALYEFETGLCTEGPCQGSSLKKLQVRNEGKYLVISA